MESMESARKKIGGVNQEAIRNARMKAIDQAIKKGETGMDSLPYPQYEITDDVRKKLIENGINLPGHYNPLIPDINIKDKEDDFLPEIEQAA